MTPAQALHGITDDYMTSEAHHPGYVLIPTDKFEQLRAASEALTSGADWFTRNADRTNPRAFINTHPEYFGSECADAISNGSLAATQRPPEQAGAMNPREYLDFAAEMAAFEADYPCCDHTKHRNGEIIAGRARYADPEMDKMFSAWLSARAYTPKAPPQTPPDAGIGSDGAGERV